jgi:hypothetical protein
VETGVSEHLPPLYFHTLHDKDAVFYHVTEYLHLHHAICAPSPSPTIFHHNPYRTLHEKSQCIFIKKKAKIIGRGDPL